MNIDDLEKAVDIIDGVRSEIRKDPAVARALDMLDMDIKRKKLIKKGKKEILDDQMLEGLVLLIEIHGLSQKQTFKAVGQIKYLSEARAKKLWFDTQRDGLGKIEDLRQHHAYKLLSSVLDWLNGDQSEPFESIHTLLRLKDKEPELYDWAKTITILDSHGVKHRAFKPKYHMADETLETDILALMKEIAASD